MQYLNQLGKPLARLTIAAVLFFSVFRAEAAANPAITNVIFPAGYLSSGQSLNIIVQYDQPVEIDNEATPPTPLPAGAGAYIQLTLGSGLAYAFAPVTSSPTNALLFSYQVQSGDDTSNAVIGTNILTQQASITDPNGDPAALQFSPSTNSVVIDTIDPTITFLSGPTPVYANSNTVVLYQVMVTNVNLGPMSLAASNISVLETGVTAADVTILNGTNGSTNVNGVVTSTNFNVMLSGLTGNGTLTVSIAEGAILDLAQNPSALTSDTSPVTVDNIAPTVTVGPPSVSYVNQAGTVTYQVTVYDLNLDVPGSLSGATNILVNAPGTVTTTILGLSTNSTSISYQVALSNMSGNGPASFLLSQGSVMDLAGNANSATAGDAFTVDNLPPVVTYLSGPTPPITNANGSVSYLVNIADPNLGSVTVTTNDIILYTTGTAAGSVGVTGAGGSAISTNFNVTLSALRGNGTVTIALAAGAILDLAKNPSALTSDTSPVTVDNIAPTVTVGPPSISYVNQAGTVTYQVTVYDLNLDVPGSLSGATNILVNAPGTVTTTILGLSTNSTSISYQVALSNMSGNGPASFLLPQGSVMDLAGNANSATAGDAFTVDNLPPVVTYLSGPTPPITNANGSVSYLVNIADANLGAVTLTTNDIIRYNSGAAAGSVVVTGAGGSATSTNFMVTLSTLSGNGTVAMAVAAGSVSDLAGNLNALSAESTAFVVDTTPPSVVITNLTTNFATANSKVSYTLLLTDTNLATNGILLQRLLMNATGGVEATTVTFITNSLTTTNANLTVTLSGFLGDGSLGITVPAGFVRDLAGNVNLQSSPSATFTVLSKPPEIAITGPTPALTTTNPVTYLLLYRSSRPMTNYLTLGDVTLNRTGSANATLLLSGTNNAWTVTLTNITGSGVLSISVAPGTAVDSLGNVALGAASQTVAVGNGPNGFKSVISVIVQTGGIAFTINGLPGASYEIQATSSLSNPDWQFVGDATADSNGLINSLVLPGGANSGTPAQFYRALLQ